MAVGFSVVSAFLIVFGFAVLIIQILVTPLSAYLVWFKLVQEGSMRGSVSFVFVSVCGYFATLISSFFYRWKAGKPLAAYTAVLAFILFIVYQHWVWLVITCGAALMLALLTAATHHTQREERRRATVLILLFAGLSIIVAFGFSSAVHPSGNKFLDTRVSPFLRSAVVEVFPRFPILYDIPGYGSTISEKHLGQKPVLSEQGVFRVQGKPGETIYLRTAVFDRFNGNSWSAYTPEPGREEAIAPASHGDSSESETGVASPDTGEVNEEPKIRFTTDRTLLSRPREQVTIEVLTDFFSRLPHTLATRYVYTEEQLVIESGNRSQGFLLETPLLNGEELILGEAASGAHDPPPPHRSRYLGLPDILSSRIKTVAASLEHDTVKATITAIGSYLTDQYSYSLETKRPSEETAFLDNFLFETREGFCVHFATAFIVLARLNDIPARYATGFLVNIPSEPMTEGVTVTGMHAHAWPELYLPQYGWIAYEATPPMRPEAYSREDFWERYFENLQPYTARQIESLSGGRVSAPVDGQKGPHSLPLGLIASVLAGAAGGAGLVVLLMRKKLIFHREPRDVAALKRIANRMVKRAKKKGIPPPSTSGWLAWEHRVAAMLPGNIDARRAPLTCFRESFFGGRPVGRADRKTLKHLYRSMR
jgi:transglutaminase-like putative cysteine protease